MADPTQVGSGTEREARFHRLARSTVCPVKDCGAEIPRRMLMCRTHWYEVPAPLRRDVRASARRMHADLGDEAAYQRWLDDALSAIEAVES